MQSASNTLLNALNNGYVLTALPKLLVEWNQNRYAGILKIDNDPSDASVGADVDNFPITSIAEPQRPIKGILKARCSKETVRPIKWTRAQIRNGEEGFTAEDFSDSPTTQRYYTAGPDSAYKYWTSPAPSTYTQNFNGSYQIPAGYEIRPYILYKTSCKVNKIVVTFDTGWARPVDYDIQTTNNGGASWTTVARNIVPNANGQVIIYRTSDSSWSQTIKRDAIGTINGIRLLVNSISYPDAHLNLIELSPRLESDLSDYVTSYSSGMSLSEPNFITPLGKASSNTGEVGLSNLDGLFNNDNTASPYYNIIDKNALLTLDLEYNLTDYGGGLERLREFTMYADQWSGQADLELTVSCKDSSKFFQETKVPSILLENVTVGEAIWRICDAIGFTNFIYDRKPTDPAQTIRYFWTDKEKTVWETFQQLAEATQTAIYFDEFDSLRIKTREAAYDLDKPASWALEATNNGGKLADVEEASIVADYEANIVNINYKDTKVSDDNRGFPEMHVLWQPEDTFVLRSSQLAEFLSSTDMVMRIDPAEAKVWPYEGTVNIEGELIKFKGKEYSYYNKSGVLTNVYLKSNDERLNIDKTLTDEAQSYKSTYTGRLTIIERGVYWSSPRDHTVDINGWIGRRTLQDSPTVTQTNGGISQNKNESYMKLTAGSTNGPGNVYTATRGNEADQAYRRYGTRLKIPTANQGRGTAGLVAYAGANDSGYYIEMIRSEILNDQAGAGRKAHNEINLFVRGTNGAITRPAGLGSALVVAKDKWYDLDVDIEVVGSTRNIVVYVDGIARIKASLPVSGLASSGRMGVFVRGHSNANFEYFYAHAGGEEYRTDEVSQFDKVRGGFVSGQWDREYVYGTRDANRRVGNKTVAYKQHYNQYFFDEFGALVHEIREMDITFEKFPALHSRLYVSNDTQIVIPEYNGNPFGAKFMLANASRDNAVAEGEDTLRFGADAAATQHMLIYGRLVFQEESQVVTVKNDKGKDVNPYQNEDSIRRRGKVEVDIDSQWIQSKAEAEALGNWILKHWSGGNDEAEVTVFGNPLFQLGDVVTLDYPDKNIYRATHKYFVVNIKNSFENGLSTALTLRRAKV